MMQDIWNAAPGFRPTKSAPSSPAKPPGVSRARPELFHVAHKLSMGDTAYVRAKNMQLVDKDPERAIPLFWAAINAGDRVDSALKDMAIVMKQQNRPEEAIEAIKSLRHRCSDQAQEALDNILLDLYKRCGRLDDQITLLKHKLYLIKQGMAFNGKRTKTARSQGKKFQVSVEQEATRLLGNLGWALMQNDNYAEAEEAYRQALTVSPDNNKMCNLGICLMKQGMISQAKEILRQVKPAVADGPKGVDSHLKAYERAQQMLKDLQSETMNRAGDKAEHSRLFNAFLGSSSIWQPQPCREYNSLPPTKSLRNANSFADENISSNIMPSQDAPHKRGIAPFIQVAPQERGIAPFSQVAPQERGIAPFIQVAPKKRGIAPFIQLNSVNSVNSKAPPCFSSSFIKDVVAENPTGVQYAEETLKRTRSANIIGRMKIEDFTDPTTTKERADTRARKQTVPEDTRADKMTELLPNNKDFEEAILAAVLGEETYNENKPAEICPKVVDKRLKVFEDITLCPSPKA